MPHPMTRRDGQRLTRREQELIALGAATYDDERYARAWAARAYRAECVGFVRRTRCAGCDLVRGIGFVGATGCILQPDPAPDDPGERRVGRRWFCCDECLQYADANA